MIKNDKNYTEKDLLPILFDIAQHTATREELRQVEKELYLKIDSVEKTLNLKIDKIAMELNTKLDSQFKWVIGIIIAAAIIPQFLKLI